VLVSTVELFHRARHGAKLGIKGSDNLEFDWPAVIARKDEIVASWSKGKNETGELASQSAGQGVFTSRMIFP
jgi:pyruvate/2-oxoglutarate dehydrogenase complex dihydrolipoamide dehydrogenase (E3) component